MPLRMPSQRKACYNGPVSLVLPSREEHEIPHPSNTFHLQLWVLHFMLRLVEFWLKEAVCDPQRSIGHEQNSELELGDKFTWTEMRLKVSYIKVPLGTIWPLNVSVNSVNTVLLIKWMKYMVKTDLSGFPLELPFRTGMSWFFLTSQFS